MLRKQFLVTKKMPIEAFKSLLGRQSEMYEMDMWHDVDIDMSRKEFLQRIQKKSGILLGFGSKHKIDSEALDAAGKDLKVVSTLSVGYDHIDIEECRRRNVRVGYTPNVLTEAVAELTVGLVIATIRRFIEANRALQQRIWTTDPFWMTGSTINGSVLGFVGAGRIGSSIMSKLKSFQPSRILYHNRKRTDSVEQEHQAEYVADLNDMLSQSDIIIVSCSLNPSSHHLLSYEQFNQMKSTSVVINISRGAVIDQKALVEALQNKRIRGAGLDVFEIEPIPLDDPLLKMDNVVLLPHIGSADVETRKKMIQLSVDNLEAGLENRKLPAAVWE